MILISELSYGQGTPRHGSWPPMQSPPSRDSDPTTSIFPAVTVSDDSSLCSGGTLLELPVSSRARLDQVRDRSTPPIASRSMPLSRRIESEIIARINPNDSQNLLSIRGGRVVSNYDILPHAWLRVRPGLMENKVSASFSLISHTSFSGVSLAQGREDFLSHRGVDRGQVFSDIGVVPVCRGDDFWGYARCPGCLANQLLGIAIEPVDSAWCIALRWCVRRLTGPQLLSAPRVPHDDRWVVPRANVTSSGA